MLGGSSRNELAGSCLAWWMPPWPEGSGQGGQSPESQVEASAMVARWPAAASVLPREVGIGLAREEQSSAGPRSDFRFGQKFLGLTRGANAIFFFLKKNGR